MKKRYLYLLYDYICDPVQVEELLENNMHLVIKRNLFTLKNIEEIADMSFHSKL